MRMDGIVSLGILISLADAQPLEWEGSIDQGYGGSFQNGARNVGRISTTTNGSRSARRGARLERGKEKALRSTKTWTEC